VPPSPTTWPAAPPWAWLADPPPEPAVVPFRVEAPQAALDDLARRLARARWPELPAGIGWEAGTDPAHLRALVDRWRDGFDWRAVEARLARHEHVVTQVDGQRLAALVARSPHPGAPPLVLLHGWPGSTLEFLGLVDRLTDPAPEDGGPDAAVDVIAPALPGYGLSGPTTAEGWTVDRIADAVDVLLARLGHDRYVAQGGDWGAMVASQLAARHPDRVAGIHLNMVIAPKPRDDPDALAGLTERELADLAQQAGAKGDEDGYRAIQGTKPQTLATALVDSPLGLLAWIAEKMRGWADPSTPIAVDDVLATTTLYWLTGTIGSANRLYLETRRRGGSLPAARIEVPTGHARFPHEGFRPPRRWVERRYHVTHWTEQPRGGHFAALEVPDLLAHDVLAFVASLGLQRRPSPAPPAATDGGTR
jgi:pimeloyl-ACP methyl ester carboxylesterase